MRSHLWLVTAFAVLAWSASPADAQPRTRDHRTRDVSADAGSSSARSKQTTRARRGRTATDRGDDVDDRAERERDRRGKRPRRRGHRAPMVSSYAPPRGPAGTEVTIRGRNFDDDVRVRYDGRRVKPSSISRRSITFEIPNNASGRGEIVLRPKGSRDDIVVGSFAVRDRTRARADRGRTAERERRARQRWKEQRKGLPKAGRDRRRWLDEEEDKLRRTRQERRRARAARLRAQWERQFLAHPQVRQELELHSERTANLERMRRLAAADDHERLVVRIDILLDRENVRHDRRMATLRAQLQ